VHEDLTDALAKAPNVVADLIESITHDTAITRPADDDWAVEEIIGHLRAADMIWTQRILFALVHDGVLVPDVDERRLQEIQFAGGLIVGDQVTAWAFARAELVGVLRALTEDEWSHTCRHAVRGEMTVIDCASVIAKHEAEHLTQLRDTAARLLDTFQPKAQ
jgi:hypothetical protein